MMETGEGKSSPPRRLHGIICTIQLHALRFAAKLSHTPTPKNISAGSTRDTKYSQTSIIRGTLAY